MTRRQKLIAFWALALIAIVLLGASLSQLELKPGLPAPSIVGRTLVIPPEPDEPGAQLPLTSFFLAVLACGGLLIFIATILQGWRGTHWRKLVSHFLTQTLILLVFAGLLALMLSVFSRRDQIARATPAPTPPPAQYVPLGPTPPSLLWTVGIGLAALLLLMVLWMLRARAKTGEQALNLDVEVERAHRELLAGGSFREIILRCYQQMILALEEEQGIQRKSSMTAEEFRRQLEAKGYPREPVRRLTALFEVARYGAWQPAPRDEQSALSCLEAILAYIRSKSPRDGRESSLA